MDRKATQLLARHRNLIKKPFQQESGEKLLLIPEKKSLSRRIKKAIEASEKNIKVVMPRRKFLPALFDLSHSLGVALKRNLAVKWVIDRRLDLVDKPSNLEYFLKFPNFKLRCISEGPLLTFGLYDDNTLIVASDPKLNYVHSQAVWTNVVPFVELAKKYFNTLWTNARAF